jgi:hypothetical protein
MCHCHLPGLTGVDESGEGMYQYRARRSRWLRVDSVQVGGHLLLPRFGSVGLIVQAVSQYNTAQRRIHPLGSGARCALGATAVRRCATL